MTHQEQDLDAGDDLPTTGPPDMPDGATEVQVTEAGFVILLRRVLPGEPTKWLAVRSHLPILLQGIERTTGECIYHTWLKMALGCDVEMDATAFRVIDLSTRDDATGNDRAERYQALEHPGRSRLTFLCSSHKISGVISWVMDPWQDVKTGLIRAALTTRGSQHALLLTAFREVMAEQLVIARGENPSAEATAYNEAMLRLCIPGQSSYSTWRRTLVRKLFNGDWRIVGQVAHHCRGCCRNAKHTLWQMRGVGLKALLPAKLRVFSMSNWTGAPEATAAFALPTFVHDLLPQAFLRAFKQQANEEAAEGPRPDAPPVAPAVADAAEPHPEAIGDGADASDIEAEVARSREPADEKAVKPVSVWKEENVTRINSARRFVKSKTLRNDLMITLSHLRAEDHLTRSELKRAWSKWDLDQQLEYKRTGKRTYRVLEAYDGKDVDTYLEIACSMVFDSEAWVHLDQKDEHLQKLLYKTAARMSSACYELERVRTRKPEFEVFDLLRSERVAEKLDRACPHQLGPYVAGFRTEHGPLRHLGVRGRLELQLIAQEAETSSASVERIHPENERKARYRNWTHTTDLPSLSAWHCARRCQQHSTAELYETAPYDPGGASAGTSRPSAGAQAETGRKSRGLRG